MTTETLERSVEARPGRPARDCEIVGPPDAPAVVVLGGISADAHVCRHAGDPRPGWWEAMAGPGRAIDTRALRVIGVSWGCGEAVTTAAHADRVASVLDGLGIAEAAVVGASYGGMVALSLAARHPRRVRRLVVISAAHEPHPMATALRSLQRRMVRLGLATDREQEALAIARGIAITTYRTAAEFDERFAHSPAWRDGVARFPVDDYLDHQGRRFVERFDAREYLALSESLDLHAVAPEAIVAPATLVSVEEDTLVPPWQIDRLEARLGAPVERVRLRSRYGHDAFLKETTALAPVLRSALTTAPAAPGRAAPAEVRP